MYECLWPNHVSMQSDDILITFWCVSRIYRILRWWSIAAAERPYLHYAWHDLICVIDTSPCKNFSLSTPPEPHKHLTKVLAPSACWCGASATVLQLSVGLGAHSCSFVRAGLGDIRSGILVLLYVHLRVGKQVPFRIFTSDLRYGLYSEGPM